MELLVQNGEMLSPCHQCNVESSPEIPTSNITHGTQLHHFIISS